MNSLNSLPPLLLQAYKMMENNTNKKHVHVSKYGYILMFSRCKYRYMYLEVQIHTHCNSICEFTIHNIVIENLMPNLYLSMESVPRFYFLYHCHVFPLRYLQRQKRTITNTSLSFALQNQLFQ